MFQKQSFGIEWISEIIFWEDLIFDHHYKIREPRYDSRKQLLILKEKRSGYEEITNGINKKDNSPRRLSSLNFNN